MTGSSTNKPLRVLRIIEGTSVDGPGLRTSIYFAGCHHHCPGCHNPESWSFEGGFEISENELLDTILENQFNVTFSGGDPMYQAEALVPLARKIKENGLDLWCYTGFTLEEIQDRYPFAELLKFIDVLVDGPFIESLRDTSLHFRGSSNQRILKLS